MHWERHEIADLTSGRTPHFTDCALVTGAHVRAETHASDAPERLVTRAQPELHVKATGQRRNTSHECSFCAQIHFRFPHARASRKTSACVAKNVVPAGVKTHVSTAEWCEWRGFSSKHIITSLQGSSSLTPLGRISEQYVFLC